MRKTFKHKVFMRKTLVHKILMRKPLLCENTYAKAAFT